MSQNDDKYTDEDVAKVAAALLPDYLKITAQIKNEIKETDRFEKYKHEAVALDTAKRVAKKVCEDWSCRNRGKLHVDLVVRHVEQNTLSAKLADLAAKTGSKFENLFHGLLIREIQLGSIETILGKSRLVARFLHTKLLPKLRDKSWPKNQDEALQQVLETRSYFVLKLIFACKHQAVCPLCSVRFRM